MSSEISAFLQAKWETEADERERAYVPLVRPYLPPLDKLLPLLTEIWACGRITNNGPLQQRLEAALQDRLGWRNVVATANGTLALQLACRSLDLDGEVIVPAFTFPATLQALMWNSLVPVLVDVEPDYLTIAPDAVEAAITPRTVAILAVHTFGQPADVLALQKVADRHSLALVYDAAPAAGVRVHNQPVTAFGDVSVVSFHATKVMHTVEGGAVTTPHESVANAVRRLRNFGLGGGREALALGTNAKLNELEAAVGLLVLDALDTEIANRAVAMNAYIEMLADIPGVRVLSAAADVQPNNAYAVVRLRTGVQARADEVHRRLQVARIDSRRYFNHCYQLADVLRRDETAVADAAAEDVLCLPLWGDIPLATLRRISDVIEEVMA
ncbi:DegT/DnrJ/EryC1/StrS family aminotransferase [Saccharothrix sp. Mg75]|uniref:DegT/DnrJ/EryC1/StrS family aminotransferase n=1 Tax=Saccharothrix sp. Mg75 TaxID=3445357 RepID=UPI003EED8CDE